ERRARGCRHFDNVREIEEEEGKIDRMHTDVDQRPAARGGPARKPRPPSRNAAPSDVVRFDVSGGSEASLVLEVFEHFDGVGKAVFETSHHESIATSGGVGDSFGAF